jgi:phage-related protein
MAIKITSRRINFDAAFFSLDFVRKKENIGIMSKTRVVLFKEADGVVLLLDWFDGLPKKVVVKCRLRLERLKELGHELRRPEADLLRDGIYELRVGYQGVNYRMLYFFHRNVAAVVSHGLTKERAVPPIEIERAVRRRESYLANPIQHTLEI